MKKFQVVLTLNLTEIELKNYSENLINFLNSICSDSNVQYSAEVRTFFD